MLSLLSQMEDCDLSKLIESYYFRGQRVFSFFVVSPFSCKQPEAAPLGSLPLMYFIIFITH